LAEIALDDVDDFLLRREATHLRYVDDFRIFCRSRREAIALKHDLTEYLYTAHRLSLESSKSNILPMQRFISSELTDPADEERRAQNEKLREILEEIWQEGGYILTPEDLPEGHEVVSRAARDSMTQLLDECVTKAPLNLGVARRLLQRATGMRTAALSQVVFENLEVLTPVFREVALYVIKCVPKKTGVKRGKQLLAFLGNSDVGELPFVRIWTLDILERRPDMARQNQALAIANRSHSVLGLRPTALLARSYGLVEWVRSHKETWSNHAPWDRRSIIWASSILPKGERQHWLKHVQESGDLLDQAVAQLAANQ
jgi:hypothetical protein